MKKLLFMLMICLLVLGACGKNSNSDTKGSGDQVEISFLYQMDDRWTSEFWNNLIKKFEEENPGIKLNHSSYPSVDKKDEYIKTLLGTGQMPDVTFAGLEGIKTMGGEVFMELPEELYSLLNENAITWVDDRVYTMPTSQYIMLDVFYNKELFENLNLEPPTTWDEFMKLNETLKENDVTPFVEAGQGISGYMLHNPMMTVMLNEIDEDYPQKFLSGELKFNGPEVTEIAEKFQSLWNEGYFHDGSLSYTGAQKEQEFMDGSAAMVIDGMFNAKKYAEGSGFTVGWFPLPGAKSADMYPVMYGEDIGISKDTKHPEEALKLVEFLFSDDVYQEIIQVGNSSATTKKEFTYEQDYLTMEMNEVASEKEAKLSFMKIEEFPAGTAEAMRAAAQDIAHGGDISQALDKFERVFRELIESQK